jgi:hypothetical protein
MPTHRLTCHKRRFYAGLGFFNVSPNFRNFFEEQMSIWGKVVKDNGVQINS